MKFKYLFNLTVRRHQSSLLNLGHPDFSKNHETRVILLFSKFPSNSIRIFFFYAAHSLKFAEIFAKTAPAIIKINDFRFEIMSKVLDFLYIGKVGVGPDEVADLLNCAKKFKIRVLKIFLLGQPKELININNFLVFYLEAKAENLEGLKENALKFFAE
jgi:hypothetical protein